MTTGLTKKQKTTSIFFDEHSSTVEILTHNTDLKKRLTKYAAEYPDLCRQTDDDGQGGLEFEIEKGRFSIRLTAPYSEERRLQASQNARKKEFITERMERTMQKHIYDEKNGLWYELHGDYYLPCLTVPPEEKRPIGIWGQRHLRYIREHRKALYTELQMAGKLNRYLADLNDQAEELFIRLVEQMANREGVTEQLKAQDQMLWVQRINNIRNRAIEVVNNDLIYI